MLTCMAEPQSTVPLSRVSTRIGSIAESATLKVDGKAKALQAAGRPLISFAAGEPDFPTPDYVVEAAVEAARDPRNHRYTAAAGLPDLREAIAEKTRVSSGLDVGIDRIIVTNGGKQAVYQAFQTLLDPGDEVLVPTPYWTTYPEAIRLAGGVPVDVFAGADQGYLVTVEQLEAAWTPRTKVLLFVSPSNPTGAVYSREQTREIGEWAESKGLWVISDEIYQDLVYDGAEAASIVDVVPALADRTILVNGVAKTYAMTGWRVGWMVGPADAIKAAGNLQSHLSSNVSNVSQRAAIAALRGPRDTVEKMREAFDRRRREPAGVKLSAAWLIERSGVSRGFRLPGSGAAVSSKHTLALTNRGTATAEDVAALARYVQGRVMSEHGVILQPEPVLVGLAL